MNPETYAISKADLILKGEGSEADNVQYGSTLSADAFPAREFDFMLSNPPYGKSWKSDLERMGGKSDVKDPRFVVEHAGDPDYSLITRSSDGQMMFLANMLSKMKQDTRMGSRIAEVHNGSSLFTGDAGQGESNIRRWIIENDWLEAIVALPLNMFYNTGIATYIWVLSNRKPEHRRGRVQLIDATQWYRPLRKNLGSKNCELSDEDIGRICDTFLAFEETEQSKIFPNEAFGYWKIVVERPLRLEGIDPGRAYAAKEIKALKDEAERSLTAPPVIKKIYKRGIEADPLRGLFQVTLNGRPAVVEYEPDTDLRDTEQIPLLEEGGVEAFLRREVLPYAPDAWYAPDSVKIGYEVSFTPPFLQAAAVAPLGGDTGGHPGAGAGNRGVAGGDRGGCAMTAMSNAMLTDQDIVNLIRTPKVIGIKTPASAYRQEHGHKRCDMDLQATSDDMKKFVVFIQQNDKFIENFSIGLRYQTGDNDLRTITLTRYNGPHGETSRYPDDHYAKPHIHRITASGDCIRKHSTTRTPSGDH